MNELLVAWYLFVNSNYDVLIMSITLLVVGGLVLEVVRLNKELKYLSYKADRDFEKVKSLSADVCNLEDADREQININTYIAEDIATLQKRLKEVKPKRKLVRK